MFIHLRKNSILMYFKKFKALFPLRSHDEFVGILIQLIVELLPGYWIAKVQLLPFHFCAVKAP